MMATYRLVPRRMPEWKYWAMREVPSNQDVRRAPPHEVMIPQQNWLEAGIHQISKPHLKLRPAAHVDVSDSGESLANYTSSGAP